MTITVYTAKEMENAFEIGRIIQEMIDREEIEVEDSKDAFALALRLSEDFEKEFPETEEYYLDLDEFVTEKILEMFGV